MLFFCRILVMCVLIVIGSKFGFKIPVILMSALQTIYVIFLLARHPYQKVFDMVGLMFC